MMGLEIFRKLNIIRKLREESEEMQELIDFDYEDHDQWMERLGLNGDAPPENIEDRSVSPAGVHIEEHDHNPWPERTLIRPMDGHGANQSVMSHNHSTGIEPTYSESYTRRLHSHEEFRREYENQYTSYHDGPFNGLVERGEPRINQVREVVEDRQGHFRSHTFFEVDGERFQTHADAVDYVRGNTPPPGTAKEQANECFNECYEDIMSIISRLPAGTAGGHIRSILEGYLNQQQDGGKIHRWEFVRTPEHFDYELRLRKGEFAIYWRLDLDILRFGIGR